MVRRLECDLERASGSLESELHLKGICKAGVGDGRQEGSSEDRV